MNEYEPYEIDYHVISLIEVVRCSNPNSWYADSIGRRYEAKKNHWYQWDAESQNYTLVVTIYNAFYGYIPMEDVKLIREYKSVIPPEQNN